jgi:hypothetical protein
MKKQSIFTIVALITMAVMTSCGNYKAKEVKLSSMNDSLNYTLGLYNGKGIKDYYLQKDSSDKAVAAMMKALDKAFKAETNNDEMYKLGLQIGNSFKMNKKQGLMGDSTLKFNSELVMQGLVNALNKFDEGMKPADADRFLQEYMMKKQAAMMPQQAPQAAPAAPEESVPAN